MKILTDTTDIGLSRRSCLAATGAALLAAGAMSTTAQECNANDGGTGADDDEILYGHGTVWNRNLPGVAAALNLSFDMRVNLATGLGAGSAHDPVYPEWNIHFAIASAEKRRVQGGESRFTLRGVVTDANTPEMIGLPVRILAETRRDTTAVGIAIGDWAFAGAGLVVIAIIAILIGLMIPAVQKVKP